MTTSTTAAGSRRQWWRSAVSVTLLVLVVLLAPASVAARWAHTHVSDTHGYLATVAPLARNPAVKDAITDQVTDAVSDRVDVPGLSTLVRSQLRRFLGSDAFATLWESTNREAHRQLVGVLTGNGSQELNVDDGKVSVNLAGLTDRVKHGLIDRGVTAASLIPAIDVSFTIVDSDQLVTAQRWFRILDRVAAPLPFVTGALVVAAIAIARRRLRAATVAALCVALGMGLLAIALAIVRAHYLNVLPQSVSTAAAAAVFDALTAPMRSVMRGWLIAALATAVVLVGFRITMIRMLRRRNAATSPEVAQPSEEKP